jgi:outer membrane protein assembly factor BamB
MSSKLISFIFLVILLGCSCTPTPIPEVEGIKPIWGTKLTGKAGIYNDGLIGLPIYNGKIMFHSTYFTGIINDNFEEDNRIHSLDMETGEIQWTYPTSYNKSKPMLFGGVPYQFNEYMVTKMWKQGSINTDKLVGLNLKTGQELWYKEIPITYSNICSTDVVGEKESFYLFEQTRKNAILCKGNIYTGETDTILVIEPEIGYNFTGITSNIVFHKEKNLIIAGAWEQNTINKETYAYKNFLYVIDAENNTLLSKIYSDFIDKEMLIARIYLVEDRIYVACGLTTICYNLNTNVVEWTYKSTESYNFMTNDVIVNNNTVFLFGSNRYVGLDAITGKKLYQGDIGCGNANAFNGFVYIISNDGKLYILDIKTGKKLHRITCPERALPNPKWGGDFFTACKPQVYGDKLYVFSCTSAYCYDAVPKEEE